MRISDWSSDVVSSDLSFLGLVAAGMMMVILLGHIDLSVPWTLDAAAMMATAVGGPLAIPVGLAVGVAIGFVNGLGGGVLRVPSMILTLGEIGRWEGRGRE